MIYRIFTTKEFDDDFDSLDKSEKNNVRKILEQLQERGDGVGKPLRYPYFREKKFGGKRLYFLVYKDYFIVLALTISNKKTQQATIDKIISQLKNYKEIIEKKIKEM
jgi:mRNA-degrading endonuclease RelE of RelBE toxin-antitoxin system